MKKVKRIIICIVLLFSVVTFVSCGKDSGSTNSEVKNTSVVTKDERQSKPPLSNEDESQQIFGS